MTVATPPISVIDAGSRTNATVGSTSSSVIVSVAAAGSATPLPPSAVPEIVTVLSGESAVFGVAVTVTVPELAVSPAAMVSVAAALTAKSPETAPAPAAAVTVTVTGSLDAPDSAAVTVVTPPDSGIEDDDSASVAVGRVSSSVRVSAAPVTADVPWSLVIVAVTVTVRPALPWWIVSSVATIPAVSVLVVVPAGMTIHRSGAST